MVNNATKMRRTTLTVGVVLAAALLLRAINLDADPSPLISRDVITDEGWWAHNARNAVLYGQWRVDDHNLGLYAAYLYNALVYVAFEMFGVGLTAMRMLSALAGWLTIVLLFLVVRREISLPAAVIAGALLGFSNLHIIYSRAGFAESTMVFFLALALLLWSLRKNHPLFAFGSGIVFALMLLTKVTAIHILAGLALVMVVEAIRRSTTRREAITFCAGLVLVIAAYGILFLVPNFSGWLEFNAANGSDTEWPSGLAGGMYSILKLLGSSFYRKAPLFAALTLLSLSVFVIDACKTGLLNMIRGARELEIISASLLIGYLASLSFTVYQPERRFLPALFLMVVVSAGVLEKGWSRLEGLANPENQLNAIGWFLVLCFLPAIGILSLRLPWAPATVIAMKLIIIAGLIGLAVALSRGWLRRGFKRILLIASRLIFVLLFLVLSIGLIFQALELWGVDARSWAANNHTALIACAAFVLATGVAMTMLIRDSRLGTKFLIVGFLIIEGVQISTWLLRPTYTLKEASTSLANILTRDDTVVTNYETALLMSKARVICRSLRRGLNLNVFETSSPQYMFVLRRNNWRDYLLEEMSPEEWPPPATYDSTKVASFELCPVPLRGPRFILELYRLSPREKRRKKSRIASGINGACLTGTQKDNLHGNQELESQGSGGVSGRYNRTGICLVNSPTSACLARNVGNWVPHTADIDFCLECPRQQDKNCSSG